jgi:subtilase family serine protease
MYKVFREIFRATALFGAVSLIGCSGGTAFVGQGGNAALATLDNGNVQSMCRSTGAHHCLGYSLTQSGLKRMKDESTLGLRRGYGGNHDLRKFGGNVVNDFLPAGYGPRDLLKAYGITASANGGGRIVALVESGDAPTLDNDLSVYRAQFGLPPCSIANGCLRKIAQDGSANLPANDPNWAGETQLDADMVSAMCPSCRILVVEASNEGVGLDIAENAAAQSGAFAISNSWGGAENSSEASYFNHPGIVITASSGDNGYRGGPQSPSDYSTVIAVGGTTLQPADNARGWSESIWSETSGGCSAVIAKPAWQTDSGCSMRTVSDISFDADPATGVAMYDGNKNDAGSGPVGWRVAGGTSVGAPAIAALFTLANISVSDASQLYATSSALNDIVSGSTGTCSVANLCNGAVGYSAPGGNGTPNGLSSL